MVITQKGEARAVLVDIETYRDTENAFALMNIIKLAEKDIVGQRFIAGLVMIVLGVVGE